MRSATLLLMLALCGLALAAVPDPTRFPGPPSAPPPPLAPGPYLGSGPSIVYDLPAGWTMISFPLASVEGAQGFPHALYKWTASGYVGCDPVHAPGSVDTGHAYATWCERPTRVEVRGPLEPLPVSCDLHPGWNMLGCPSAKPIPWAQVTLTRAGGVTRTVAEAASPAAVPSQAWVLSRAHVSPKDREAWIDLRTSGAQLTPGEDTWVFAWTSLQLNWNGRPLVSRPMVTEASAANGVVEIRGSGFGPRGDGIVTLNGLEMEADDIVSWADDRVRMRLPALAHSGPLVVLVDRFPSNAVHLKVPIAKSGGVLKGRVETSAGRPLASAQVMLDNGQCAMSAADGSFRIDHVPPGTYGAFISRLGYNEGRGQVTISGGKSRHLLVSLSPSGQRPAASADARGTLWVEAYKSSDWRVYKIEVWEYGDHGQRWTAGSWDTSALSRSLQCSGAHLDRSYTIRVTWRDPKGYDQTSQIYRKLTGKSQTVNVYKP